MFKKLNSKLERLFDQNNSPVYSLDHSLIEAQKNFTAVDNNQMLENLSYVFSEEVDRPGLQLLFSQLCSHFEIGYLFSQGQQTLQLHGKNWQIPPGTKNFKIPKTALYKIFKSDAAPFLGHFALSELDVQKKMACYLIRIAEHHTLIFLTATAEPWAKLKIAALQNALMKIHFNL